MEQERHLYGEIKNALSLDDQRRNRDCHPHKQECWSLEQVQAQEGGNGVLFCQGQKTASAPSPESLAILSSCCPILSQPLHERCAAALPPPCSRKASGNTQHLALLPRQRHCFFNNTSLGNRLQSHFRSQAVLTLT